MMGAIELDWVDDKRTDKEIIALAGKYHLIGQCVGHVNDWPTYRFFGEEKNLKKFMKREYDPDSVRDFDCYVTSWDGGDD